MNAEEQLVSDYIGLLIKEIILGIVCIVGICILYKTNESFHTSLNAVLNIIMDKIGLLV